ncbi:RNA-directed DNA polymerase, eukaryota, reverse transcriptase zinc-binding domain protein [Tanacetum coccineum]|uniref:RNA-directed DNA polymerase, eukaryota, reverse transcriptase zinc-binding domain protein n=1 Tax=Tanacetum coccineum TaxID=301880 RepID=A0ABQ5B1M1_9ASTR
MLGELNTTIISLVPKSNNPRKASDYRHIAYCGVVYKCVRKVITNRLKKVLNGLVDTNQGAFIEGRQISDNILLIQELMNGYTWKGKIRKCIFKVDIQKAYDTVSWDFLKITLEYFGFYTKRGLSQGDPVSPYLFTIIMEVFNLMIMSQVSLDKRFKYHWGCKEIGITHLCFVDGLMLLCYADKICASILRRALDEFSHTSGLYPSMIKSTIYFGNVSNDVKCSILMFFPFNEGVLPAKYLGVPLVSMKLYKEDCNYLIEVVYWAYIFVLPINFCESINKLLKNFLWFACEVSLGIASVAWKDICIPKSQGGLGLKSLHNWNEALLTKHLWNILVNKESIWVRRPLSRVISQSTITTANLSLNPIVRDLMAIKGRLKTQDRLSKWLNILDMERLKVMARLEDLSNIWAKIIFGIINKPACNGIWSIIQRLVLGAMVYFVWQERNFRLFRKCERSDDKLFLIITKTVRLKLMGLALLKASPDVKKAVEVWNFPLKVSPKRSIEKHDPVQAL